MGNSRQRAARRKFCPVGGASEAQGVTKKVPAEKGGAESVKKKSKKDNGQKKRKREEGARIVGQHDGEVVQNGLNVVENLESSRSSKGNGDALSVAKDHKTSKKAPGTKHPLRVAGMRPGEGCFLCKGTDHIAKFCPTKSAADRKKMCLLCRRMGHTVKNCPSNFGADEGNSKFCYNCGEHGHRLSECKQPTKDGGTAFAECFVCKQKGHLSKNCPSNPHGIYPKGGCCKLCGGVTHLAKDCPTKTAGHREKLKISTEAARPSAPGETGKRIVFQSGDDLVDDFGELDYGSDGDKGDADKGGMKSDSKQKKVLKKPQTRKAPKVVKFQRQ